jgi:flagellar motor switch protein FliN/FliY
MWNIMSNGFLSQEEIDSLLNGSPSSPSSSEEEILTDIEKDLLGEVGNISMGSASTALSQIINQQVNITTPVVSTTTLKELKQSFEIPNIALEVKYVSGIFGENLLVMKITDAFVIANLMMGGDGKATGTELSEIEISAVSEAMNQMIGSAATSMATMFAREVNISPPKSSIWEEASTSLTEEIDENDTIVKVSFRLTIGDLVDSNMIQILPVETARKIIDIMMGKEEAPAPKSIEQPAPRRETETTRREEAPPPQVYDRVVEKPTERSQPPVEVHAASFQSLGESSVHHQPKNIDLILDVPLEISVVLGRTKKSIKDILNLGTGSLVQLDKLAEEPVEILVNGKRVAYGEVVVVDENFGVRITSIVSNSDRVKTLGK